MISFEELNQAIVLIENNEWDKAHEIAQVHTDPIANWLHAVLHKIEGDTANSRYWYARTQSKRFEDYAKMHEELAAILKELKS